MIPSEADVQHDLCCVLHTRQRELCFLPRLVSVGLLCLFVCWLVYVKGLE